MNKTRKFVAISQLSVLLILLLSFAGPSAGQELSYTADPPYVQLKPGTLKPTIKGSALTFPPYCDPTIPIICYSPVFLQSAYNFPPTSSLDGSGQTIIIVEAYGSPTIQLDLQIFDFVFGIPDPPSFTVLCPQACPPIKPDTKRNDVKHGVLGWTLETSLDVEWAHAMAPGANIVLVIAPTSSGNAINNALGSIIANYPGAIISQSFGVPENMIHGNNAQIKQAHSNFVQATSNGMTILAAAGDGGATNGANTANAGYPASDPLVLAVGGTQGDPYPNGLVNLDCTTICIPLGYGGEQVWNETAFLPPGATGGAPSLLYPVPAFQQGLGLTSRTIPDVAYDAAINGGVLVIDTFLSADSFFLVGGTSVGTPQWAAIIALANQYSVGHGHGALGYVNPAIYKVAESASYANDFHDIKVGNNQLLGTPVGFSAGTGYDFATGWGTPNVANLIPDLVNTVFP